MSTKVTQNDNGRSYYGDAFLEGYVKVQAADQVDRYMRLTLDGALFDAIPGQPLYYPPAANGSTKAVWVKVIVDSKDISFEIRTFDPPAEGTARGEA